MEAAREELGQLDLSPFGTASQSRFARSLDRATRKLESAPPKKARHWGLARKGLNIFLRDCLYTAYLREAYHLDRAERFFEVPLDSISGTQLFRESGRVLPKWPGVRRLDRTTSDLYQAVAAAAAKKAGFARIHLDAIWWGTRDGGA
jgi:hypothetical protein